MEEPIVDGGIIRKLWIGEADQYLAHLLRLDGESRRSRFGGAIADEVVRRYIAGGMGPGTITHGFLVDGLVRGVAELKPLGSAFATEAEVAFSIERPWQGHGVGSALLGRTLLAARNRGIERIQMICLADNSRMQQLARKYAAELSFELGSVVGKVAAPHATPLSLFRELLADGHGIATTMLDVHARLLRPA
ncbi:MAG TPA: GNAT family N-acetyltransferase [Xanthobacteraceae bacterium]|nr:GNAT family N-acetyltransferase [Xanthobacteraceae bacterium]